MSAGVAATPIACPTGFVRQGERCQPSCGKWAQAYPLCVHELPCPEGWSQDGLIGCVPPLTTRASYLPATLGDGASCPANTTYDAAFDTCRAVCPWPHVAVAPSNCAPPCPPQFVPINGGAVCAFESRYVGEASLDASCPRGMHANARRTACCPMGTHFGGDDVCLPGSDGREVEDFAALEAKRTPASQVRSAVVNRLVGSEVAAVDGLPILLLWLAILTLVCVCFAAGVQAWNAITSA